MICTFRTQFRHLINNFKYCGFIASLGEKKVENKKLHFSYGSERNHNAEAEATESSQTLLAFKQVQIFPHYSTLNIQEWKSEKNLKFFAGKFLQKEKLNFVLTKVVIFRFVCVPTAANLPYL